MRGHAVRGPAAAAALARCTTKYGADVADQASPIELINFGEAVNFPLLFGEALAQFGAATLVHLLLVSVSRRRSETGLLQGLGSSAAGHERHHLAGDRGGRGGRVDPGDGEVLTGQAEYISI